MSSLRKLALGVLLLSACGQAPSVNDADAGSNSSDGGTMPGDGGKSVDPNDGCPAYQHLCGGSCIPTSTDPKNCGGCGVVCAVDKVCSGGACTAGCLPGLTACSQRCVDLQSDNGSCGACGNVCAANQGCVAGACVTALTTTALPAGSCTNGGPPIQIATGTKDVCSGSLAATTFLWALCSCNTISHSGPLVTDGFDSNMGPYIPGGLGAGVGVNTGYGSSGSTNVGGALYCGGDQGFSSAAVATVAQELHVSGTVSTAMALTVGADAYVSEGILASSSSTIAGKLYIPADATVQGVTAASVVRQPVTVAPPCKCDESDKIPVQAIVAQAKLQNDNSKIALDAAVLASYNVPTRLDLPCGSYFLTKISGAQPLVIGVHGHVALFVEASINVAASIQFTVDPAGSLDLFVGGSIAASGELGLGSPNYPALSRMYVGGSSFSGSADARFAGNVYAINAKLSRGAGSEVYGSLIADDISASSDLTVHYDRQILNVGKECEVPSTPPQCTGPQDCNNQPCKNGVCGPCTTNGDCPAPLLCVSGTCSIIVL